MAYDSPREVVVQRPAHRPPARPTPGKVSEVCTQPQTALSGATATGPGATIDLGHNYSVHTARVSPSGSSTVNLEISHDGTNWSSAGGIGGSALSTFNAVARYVRANMTGYGGSPVTVTIASVGD